MTREEEILKEAGKAASANTQIIGDWGEHYLGFIHGAKWADRTMIDKACEWLVRELCYTARGINLFNNKAATDEFVELFKQAMKGE